MSRREPYVIERTTRRQVYVGRSVRTQGDVVLSIDETTDAGKATTTFVFSPATARAIARMLAQKAEVWS